MLDDGANDAPGRVVSIPDAARHMGVSERTVYRLLKAGKLDLRPAITDRIPMTDFAKGMDRLRTGEASKILLYPDGVR